MLFQDFSILNPGDDYVKENEMVWAILLEDKF